MAGPIKLAILADASSATAGVRDFAGDVDRSVGDAADSLDRSTRRVRESGDEIAGGFDRAGEAADGAEGKAQGFADTLTGATDVMAGAGQIASGDLYGGLLSVGTGMADLAGGAAAFLIPALQKAAGAMKALNLAFLTNPVFLVIAAIVALVAVFIIAYKRSETFRRIVNAAFRGVWNMVQNVVGWIKRNWPLLFAIITGPIGLAVRWVVQRWDRITDAVRKIPGKIKGAFRGANTMLRDVGRRIVEGLWNGITGLTGWLAGKVRSFIESTVPGPIRSALGLASPSRVARQIGQYFGQGLGLGLEDERTAVQRAAGRLAAATIARPSAAAGTAGAGGTANSSGPSRRLELDDSETGRFLLRMVRDAARRQGLGDVAFTGRSA